LISRLQTGIRKVEWQASWNSHMFLAELTPDKNSKKDKFGLFGEQFSMCAMCKLANNRPYTTCVQD